jgi:tetratricopeptide (TPR) repeat protein
MLPGPPGPQNCQADLGRPGVAHNGDVADVTDAADRTWTGSPFVGRAAVVAEISDVLARSRAGRARLVIVEGEAGIGKTTLAERVAAQAAEAACGVRYARGWPGGGAPALWPWAQLIDDDSVLAGGDPAGQDPASARFTQFRQVTSYWSRAAARQPLLLVIDDLHSADVASVLLLAHLAAALQDQPIVFLATVRTGETLDERLELALAELRRVGPAVISLSGLPRDALVELIHHAGLTPETGLVDALDARTGGNPFFVTELLRALSASAHPGKVAATEVPRHVADVVRRRLARLPTAVAEVLQAAAVLGARGEVSVLAGTAGLDLDLAIGRLDAAVAAGLAADDGTGRWRFTHDLVRDAIYLAIPAQGRLRLHARALDALSAAGGAPSSELARHAMGALPLGDRASAARLSAEAGQEAMARLSYEEAADHFRRALDADPADPRRRAELLLSVGEAHACGGDTERAREAFLKAAQDPDRPEILSAAALGFADPGADLGLACRTDDPRTAALLERALAALAPGDSRTAVLLRARLASELYFSGRPVQSLAASALDMARRLHDDYATVAALAVVHDGHVVGTADTGALLASSAELLRLARATGDRRALLVAHRARVLDLLAAGDIAGVDAEISAFRQLVEEAPRAGYWWWLLLWRAMRVLLDGDHAKAEALAVEAFDLGSRPFAGLAFANLSFLLFFLRREQGRLAELEPAMRDYAAERADIPAIGAAQALLYAETGRLDEAAGILARLGHDGFARLRDRNWPASWFQLARASFLAGDRASAGTLYELGLPLAGQCVMVSLATVCLGSADLGLAWLADTLGLDDQAMNCYRRATSANARIGARSWLAQSRADHARLLARRGDAAGARELAALALDAARAIGLPDVEARILATTGAGQADTAFARDGSAWELSYAGTSVHLPPAKGLDDIAYLLARPGEPVHAFELLAREGAVVPDLPGQEIFDARAKKEIRARLDDLAEEVADAEAASDLARAARARDERDQVIAALTAATGLGGRSRRLDDPGERARKTVTARIRNSIRRIERAHPDLARHLERSIDTGSWCVYQPEHPVSWRL